jgi:hypothetical protein
VTITDPRGAETRITGEDGTLHGLQALPYGQAGKGKDEAGRRVREGGCDGGAILLASQTDDEQMATRLLLLDLLTKSIKRNGTRAGVLEADLVGTGDHEVRRDEAVLGTEHDPGIAEVFGVLAVEPKGVPVYASAAATGPRSGSRSQILLRPQGTTTSESPELLGWEQPELGSLFVNTAALTPSYVGSKSVPTRRPVNPCADAGTNAGAFGARSERIGCANPTRNRPISLRQVCLPFRPW